MSTTHSIFIAETHLQLGWPAGWLGRKTPNRKMLSNAKHREKMTSSGDFASPQAVKDLAGFATSISSPGHIESCTDHIEHRRPLLLLGYPHCSYSYGHLIEFSMSTGNHQVRSWGQRIITTYEYAKILHEPASALFGLI